ATLSELNTSLDIVCLITQSLSKSHELAVQTCKNEVPSPDTLIDGKYTHADYIFAHLDFLQFLLKEGDIYLAWPRCKEIWDTLVNNPKASLSDKEVVESLEPLGLEFIWEIVLECLDQQLADDAISLLLDMAYMNLSSRLKRDPPQIHQKFISQCYAKLEKSLLHMNQSTVSNALSNAAKTLSAMAVSEISSLSPASKRSCLQHIFRILILVERYISTVEEQFSSPRVLLPHAACFFGKPVTIYVFFDGNNNDVSLQCHSNEQMRSVYSKIAQSGSHTVDQLQQISFERLTQSSSIQTSPSSSNQVDRHHVVHVSGTEHENKLLHQLCNFSNIKATVKVSSSCAQLKEVSSSSNWNELPDTSCYADNQEDSSTSSSVVTANTNSQTASSSSCPSPSGSVLTPSAGVETPSPGESKLKEEKKLPGVVMAGLGKNVFNMLYQLSLLEDPKILDTVRRILYLIPTDPTIADKMDSICSSGSAGSVANSLSNFGGKTSQSNSPAKKEKNTNQAKKKETNLNVLKSLLEFEGSEITPFRLLYNVEVLSSKLIPVEGTMQFDSHFSDEFLSCGGLSILISLLHRESLPHDMDYEVRQSIYLIVLQLLRYMLCDKENNSKSEDQDTPMSYHQYPQPPKRSAFDAYTLKKESLRHKGASLEVFYHQRNMMSSSSSNLATKYLQNMPPEEWLEMVSSIMRVAWASAAGKLFLCSTGMASLDPSLNSPDSYKSSRENSTGSAHSSGSESERTFQGGICMQQSSLLPTDALIAIEALPLLITSLSLRADFIEKWYNLPSVKEFIIELLIGCSSWNVREKACQQFIRLTTVKTTNSPQPSQFLTQILHKARLPLWVSSTSARGATLKFVSQCSQYFDLISHLLSSLTQNSQDILNINASQMIEDEIVWMLNFTSTREATRERPESGIALLRNAENLLVAGHLKLISSLLSCENIDKMKCGEALIPLLIYEYLFPSSKLVLGPASNSFETLNKCSAKCTGIESRMTAYMLLAQVAVTSPNNFKTLSKNLTSLHHQLDRDSIKEFERCPVVEGRCPSGFVGLKNGGATCYMNSVLQQLFLVPGIQEDILSVNSDEECDDSLFFQLQNLFGHLLESQLQYYTPEKFWSCVSMGGQPINIREQQDAFEFYSRLSEQIDDYLKGRNLESVFSRRFEGLYSIQRICQDCPHRYEREEPFLALNLTVTKCSDLHDSLDQLVKGELLEGDNAYYCEKCSKKRTAVIRTCIKTLPQVLVIQLKRFGYDWEASRALKFDDYYK
ncbi:Ubiquitin carboxyl-terminal hydrolase 24, partial [Armadillidium nasatum]